MYCRIRVQAHLDPSWQHRFAGLRIAHETAGTTLLSGSLPDQAALQGEYTLRWARDSGYRGMQFNAVVATNSAAVHLWQSLGFLILATVPEAFDHHQYGLVGLHVMFQRL